ncbi:MAG: DoxX family protein [Verrucomicrobia bacterium]|nr:DoxX family protein [Verrucomicrobiota bacterium]
MNWRFLATSSRIAIGIVFLLACISKILSPHEFATLVFYYQILPHSAINAVALFVPMLELFCAFALFFAKSFREAAAWIVLIMLIVFTAAIGSTMLRGIDITCGCFSVNPDAETIGTHNIVRNIGLIILTLVVLFDARGRLPER